MRIALTMAVILYLLYSCNDKPPAIKADLIIADGRMPNMVRDESENLHLVFGSGDSIMYTYSSDHGRSFSVPSVVAILPDLAASHTRGPQIATSNKGLIVIACNSSGNIFSYNKDGAANWIKTTKVNDVDTIAEEGLMSLSADKENAFAVWLDLRNNKRNKIYGAHSNDGGKTWSENVMVYTSPDSINKNAEIQTVWRRKAKIFAANPDVAEKEIGEGKSCTMETVNNKNVYAWTENEDVVVIKPQGERKYWENDNQIYASILEL